MPIIRIVGDPAEPDGTTTGGAGGAPIQIASPSSGYTMPSMDSRITDAFAYVFAKGGYTYGSRLNEIDGSPVYKSENGPVPAFNASYQGDTYLPERRMELRGYIDAASQSALRDAKDLFYSFHKEGAVDQFIIGGNRWLWGAVDGPIPERWSNFRQWQWEANLFCGDPYYYANALHVKSWASGSTGLFDAGGNRLCTPWFVFNVASIATAGTSYLEIINNSVWLAQHGRTQSWRYYPRNTGIHTVYFGANCTYDPVVNRLYRHKVVHHDASIGLMGDRYKRGQEILLAPTGNLLSLNLSGVALTGAASLKSFERY